MIVQNDLKSSERRGSVMNVESTLHHEMLRKSGVKALLTFGLVLLASYVANSQVQGEVNVLDRDALYLHYTPPNVITDDFEYQRFTGKASFPIIRSDKFSAFNTAGLDVHRFSYKDGGFGEASAGLDTYYNINYSLVVNYKLSDRWSLNAFGAGFMLSNLQESPNSDDIMFNGNALAEYSIFRKDGGYFLLGFGLNYVTVNGTTLLTPLTQLKARLTDKWSFVLGLPNTYVKWDINEKNSLKALIDLNDFSANLNGTVTDLDIDTDRAVFTVLSAGVEYNRWFTSSFGGLFRITQGIWKQYELRNSDNDPVYEFDADLNQPFISIGIKFNPIRSIQNNPNAH